MTMYFVNDEHRFNYERMKGHFPVALKDTEYQVACYITAAPLYFYKFENKLDDFDSPLDWIIKYQCKYNPKGDDESLEDFEERKQEGEAFVDYDLSASMQEIGKFALNLFNSWNESNLMDCLGSLDEINYRMVRCALDVRMGYYKGQ